MAKNPDIRYDDGMEVVPSSDLEAVQHPTPAEGLEALPPSGLELAQPGEIKHEAEPGREFPVAGGSAATSKRWTTRRVVVLVVIVFLVLVVVALGAGLGISARNKEQNQSTAAYGVPFLSTPNIV